MSLSETICCVPFTGKIRTVVHYIVSRKAIDVIHWCWVFDHDTPLLHQLCWLLVQKWVDFKMANLVYHFL